MGACPVHFGVPQPPALSRWCQALCASRPCTALADGLLKCRLGASTYHSIQRRGKAWGPMATVTTSLPFRGDCRFPLSAELTWSKHTAQKWLTLALFPHLGLKLVTRLRIICKTLLEFFFGVRPPSVQDVMCFSFPLSLPPPLDGWCPWRVSHGPGPGVRRTWVWGGRVVGSATPESAVSQVTGHWPALQGFMLWPVML